MAEARTTIGTLARVLRTVGEHVVSLANDLEQILAEAGAQDQLRANGARSS